MQCSSLSFWSPPVSNNNNARPGQTGGIQFYSDEDEGSYNYEAKPQHWEENSQELMENVGRKIVAKVKCLIHSFNQFYLSSWSLHTWRRDKEKLRLCPYSFCLSIFQSVLDHILLYVKRVFHMTRPGWPEQIPPPLFLNN